MPLFLAGTQRVSTIHDVIPFIYPNSSTFLDWIIYHCWLPVAVRRLDGIITVSYQSKRDIVRHLPVRSEKVTVVPNAANARYCPLPVEEVRSVLTRFSIDLPYILYVGSTSARKNVLRLVEAYALLRRWSLRWTLVIAGGGHGKHGRVREAVERLDLSDNVHFIGYVGEAELPALYNGADLFIFPSLYEGFGLPVLEAMACGTPVVTSNVSSLPEVAGDAALLVDPYNVGEIAEAMRRVLQGPTLAEELRAKGLERAKQFTWEQTARQTLSVYAKVLQH
jgi:glycosyltransferase involved in cell wall biosynthesis